jgi:Putative abortive phage resistance protein AbiGi, antitoxin
MLSSATLFHFTRSLATLKTILASGFKPFYSSEDLTMFGVSECPGIPMVSFCDIPLSQAKQHVADYGRYAIGLDKKWGMAKNVSPVHYIYQGSICARVISNVYDSLPKEAFYANCTCMKFDTRTAIFFYGKPYRGHLRRKHPATGETIDKGEVTFYDEREWRYVPFADQTIKGIHEIPPGVRTMLSEKEYERADALANASTLLHASYRLTFGADDTRYLIVDSEEEIPELVDFLDGVQGDCENTELGRCTTSARKRLTTRLISMAQIERDF